MENFRMQFYRGGDDSCFTEADGGILNGEFFIHCTEEGEDIKKYFGTSETEYAVQLDAEETERFFAHIEKEGESLEDACRRELSGKNCMGRFYEIYREAGIEYRTANIW